MFPVRYELNSYIFYLEEIQFLNGNGKIVFRFHILKAAWKENY
jgi:hypothetical protein